jgi:hypothetical protein
MVLDQGHLMFVSGLASGYLRLSSEVKKRYRKGKEEVGKS